jgi:hypothetical protein
MVEVILHLHSLGLTGTLAMKPDKEAHFTFSSQQTTSTFEWLTYYTYYYLQEQVRLYSTLFPYLLLTYNYKKKYNFLAHCLQTSNKETLEFNAFT